MHLDFEGFQETLHKELDYSSEILCEEPGQYSVRGGLIDLYPVNSNQPYRIDFFGDEVDEIRTFDPSTQRSAEKVEQILISSAGNDDEKVSEGGFFSFLPFHTTWVFIEPERMISEFPMAFHQSEHEKIQKNCLELCWNPAHSKINSLVLVKSILVLVFSKISLNIKLKQQAQVFLFLKILLT